jgi:hypothetical protein
VAGLTASQRFSLINICATECLVRHGRDFWLGSRTIVEPAGISGPFLVCLTVQTGNLLPDGGDRAQLFWLIRLGNHEALNAQAQPEIGDLRQCRLRYLIAEVPIPQKLDD